jgi:5-methylthioadenosine/S-adenosylhomocysteine deaminase
MEALNVHFPLERKMNVKDARVAARLACTEMIKNGTTCCLDNVHPFYPTFSYGEASAQAIHETGMRGIVAPAMVDMEYPEWMRTTPDEGIEETERLIQKWNGKGDERVRIWFGPITPGANVSEKFMKKIKYSADQYDVGITVHIAETPQRVDLIRTRYGSKGHVCYLNDIGILGPNLLAAHCVWVSNEEIRLLKTANANVVHNPSSNMFLADGVAPVPRMLRAGVNVALGTDSPLENNKLDMFQEMRGAVLLHKVFELDASAITACDVLDMATINGARALGLETEIGSIEKQKKADMILVNLEQPHMVPVHDIIANLVYSGSGSDVDTTIIDGKIVMENRQLRTVKEREVIKEATRTAERILGPIPKTTA